MRGKRLKASGFHALRSKEKFFTEIMDLSNCFDKTRREFSTQIWRKKHRVVMSLHTLQQSGKLFSGLVVKG